MAKPAKRSVKLRDSDKRDEQVGLFGKMCLAVGGFGILGSLMLGSVWPIVIAVTGLFGILSFMNGLI
jgi:hypothetical protein